MKLKLEYTLPLDACYFILNIPPICVCNFEYLIINLLSSYGGPQVYLNEIMMYNECSKEIEEYYKHNYLNCYNVYKYNILKIECKNNKS